MGQVYRATDTTLSRDVAIKVLPDAFAADHDRVVRLEREAKTLASLNHPHIASVYGFEKSAPSAGSGVVHALVMEFVDGQTLADRLLQGPIPVAEALPIAKQIALALEAAHDQGIVHRDLKPANVKLKADDSVKVLDFGLAKALDAPGGVAGVASASMSPTITSPALTQAGMILGTAAYMAPEQARGRLVDRRADIWAFGAVLFEMLTGTRAFPGEDVTDTLAAVVRAEPDWSLLPRDVSPVLAAFLKRSLQKDPRQRLGDIRDMRLALEGAFDVAPGAAAPAAAPPRTSRLPWLLAAAAGLVALALAIPAIRHLVEPPPTVETLRLTVSLPHNSDIAFLDLSPDGRRLLLQLYTSGKTVMHVRSLDSPELRPLPGTETARTPFWSSDSRFIGFFADGALKVIPAAGGPVRQLCTGTGLGTGGTWNKDGIILFGSENGPLRQVNPAADQPTCTVVGNADRNSFSRFPTFLPDGTHYLYVGGVAGALESRGVYLAALDDPTPHRILSDYSSVVYAPKMAGDAHAHLLFLRDTTLMAQPFDEATRTAVGDPIAIAPDATTSYSAPQVAASVSHGTLAYVSGGSQESQLTWIDRDGKVVGTLGPRAPHAGVALSPDGTAVATGRRATDGSTSRWLYDAVRGSETRFLPAETPATATTWFPDGSRVVFGMPNAAATRGVYQKDPRGGADPELVFALPEGSSFVPSSFSSDGKWLVYTSVDPKTQSDIWVMPWSPKPDRAQAVRLVGTAAVEGQGQVSPDVRWLAYASNETGEYVVYIRPFPSGTGAVRVGQGAEPRWSADGKTLYLKQNPTRRDIDILAASIEPDGKGSVRVGTPKRLFGFVNLSFVVQSNAFGYSPHPDGQRFLVNALTNTEDSVLNVVTNWQTMLDRR